MDGAHDMGGVEGYGPVRPEPDEPVFHAEWERRAFAMTLAMARPGAWTIDMSRFARENRPHDDYLSKSYYQLWLAGLERLIVAHDLVSSDEIAEGRAMTPPRTDVNILRRDDVDAMLRRGGPTERNSGSRAPFSIGDRVRARNINPPTHIRLPRYVRGHIGTIELIHGCHVLPDSSAHGAGENPQWLYTVTFNGHDLWGAHSDPTVQVSVDAWESYLEPYHGA